MEYQEEINEQKKILEENKIQQMKLNKQQEEIEKLENEINTITQNREKQMKVFDKYNVANYSNNRGREVKLRNLLDKKLEDQTQLNFKLNLLNKRKEGNKKI